MARQKREMYNSEQKENYMAQYSHPIKPLEGYFRRLGDAERRIGKDIAEMNQSELITALSSLKIRSLEARTHLVSLIRAYIKWAVLYGFTDNADAIDDVTANSISEANYTVRQMLSGPDQLNSLIYSSMDLTNKTNRSTRNALILWLLFYGIDNADLCNLKMSDIDFNHKIVRVGGDRYDVSDDVCIMWKQWAAATYIESRGNSIMELAESDNLFRSPILTNNGTNKTADDTLSPNAIIKIVQDAFLNHEPSKDAGISVSPQRLILSGNFYRIWLLEKEGTDITPEIIAQQTKLKSAPGTEAYRAKTRKWRIDYEEWKVAFGYGG